VDDPHFWAGVFRPFFWLLVMLPALAGLRWVLIRYVKPRLPSTVWNATQRPVRISDNALVIAVLVLVGVALLGLFIP
jgi:hypothetical protein